MRLKEGDSMKEHVKQMTEVFGELAVIDEPVSEEDKVVYILASLPDAYDVLSRVAQRMSHPLRL